VLAGYSRQLAAREPRGGHRSHLSLKARLLECCSNVTVHNGFERLIGGRFGCPRHQARPRTISSGQTNSWSHRRDPTTGVGDSPTAHTSVRIRARGRLAPSDSS
jgi:hypothetical protein